MDTLWASLIGLFVIALAVVVVFNLLQGRQTRLRDAWRDTLAAQRKPAPPPPPAEREEPALGEAAGAPQAPGARIEPTFGPGPAPSRDGEPAATPLPLDDVLDAPPAPRPPAGGRTGAPERARATPPDGGSEAGAATARPERPVPSAAAVPADTPSPVDHDPQPDRATGPVLDPRLDCIVVFGLGAPVGAERVLAAASTLRRAGSKPIAIEVDAGDGRWILPHASLDAAFRVRAGVLLANRHGPLNAMEFSDFSDAMQALGRAIGAGGAIVPDMGPVLEHARQLDEACARFDAVLGLNVETPTALSPGELAALAAGLELHERGNTRFAALGDQGEVLFSLALGERAEQLTLLLDVPRAPQAADPWWRMVDVARACAERTGGRVVDDAGQPMTDTAAVGVARQLAGRYASLQEAGLDAGSAAALRVFN